MKHLKLNTIQFMSNIVNFNQQIIGIGTDIIEIDRLKDIIQKYEDKFLDKTFSKKEQKYCLKHSHPHKHFAARFAAKEAVAKSLGHGFGKTISLLDIEIINDELGKPNVYLSESCSNQFQKPYFFISISHSKNYATATAIALK